MTDRIFQFDLLSLARRRHGRRTSRCPSQTVRLDDFGIRRGIKDVLDEFSNVGEGVVERDLDDTIYAISIDISTVDTGMDELEPEGKMLREGGRAGKGGALGQATDATKGVGRRVCGHFPVVRWRARRGERGRRGGDWRGRWQRTSQLASLRTARGRVR